MTSVLPQNCHLAISLCLLCELRFKIQKYRRISPIFSPLFQKTMWDKKPILLNLLLESDGKIQLKLTQLVIWFSPKKPMCLPQQVVISNLSKQLALCCVCSYIAIVIKWLSCWEPPVLSERLNSFKIDD